MYQALHFININRISTDVICFKYLISPIALFFLPVLSLLAQAPIKQWDKTFGGSAYDEARTVIQCSDGGFLFAGFSFSAISGDKTEPHRGDRDCWLIKTDALGNKLWDKTLGGNGEDNVESVIQTSDGGYLLAGSTSSDAVGDISAPNKGVGFDFWIVKISSTGVKEWDKRYGGDQSEYITSAKQTSDGGYILAGFSGSGQSGDKTEPSRGKADFWIVKITSAGIKQWDKTIGGSGEEQNPSIIQTYDGTYDYILSGWSESGISGDKNEPSRGGRDYWVVKLTSNGSKVWDKTFGGSGSDEPSKIISASYNEFLISGTSSSGISGNKTTPNKGSQDFWLVRINESGVKIWDKTYGGSSGDVNSDLIEVYDNNTDSNGNFILLGHSGSGISGDKTEVNRGLGDFWILQIDSDGNKLWDKTYGGNDEEYAFSIKSTLYGGLILAGMSKSGLNGDKTALNKGSADYWVIKLAPSPPQVPDEFNATASSRTQVNLSWGEYCEIADFVIERSLSSSGPFTAINAGNNSFSGYLCWNRLGYVDTVLAPNTTYYYRIKAVNDGGSSPYSPIVSATTMADVTSPINAMAEWNKRFGGTQDETLQTSLKTTDGGYLLAGSSRSGLEGDKSEASRGSLDFWILKLAADGTKLWDKRFGGTGYDGLYAAIQTSDGGYLLGGTSSSVVSGDKSEGNRGAGDYWIVKISSSGVKEWDKTFGGSALDELRSVIRTSDGGYLIGGYSLSAISGDKTEASYGRSDYWVVKVTASGVKQWDKRFGGNDVDDLSTMIQTLDGNYLIGGTSESDISGNRSEFLRASSEAFHDTFEDYWIVKISSSGSKLWDKAYGGGGADRLNTILPTTDGGFLLGGNSASQAGFEKSQGSTEYATDSYPSEGMNQCLWIVKITLSGVKQWDKTFITWGDAYSGSTHSFLSSITQTLDGGYLIGASSQANGHEDKTEGSRCNIKYVEFGTYYLFRMWFSFDYWMIKINSNGEIQWDKTLGGFGEDYLGTAVVGSDGSILLAGSSTSAADGDKTQTSRGKSDFWVVKTKANKPQAPSLSAEAISRNQIKLHISFDRSQCEDSEDGYLIERSTSTNGPFVQITTMEKYCHLYESVAYQNYLLSNTTYYYRARAKNGDALSNYSPVVSVMTMADVASPVNATAEWNKRFGGSQDETLQASLKTSDGGYLLAGSSRSGLEGDKSEASRGSLDFWILKLAADGTKLWDKRFGGTGYDGLYAAIQTSDGGYLLGGTSSSVVSGDKSEGNRGAGDYWIVKISSSGVKEWDKTFGGSALDELRSVIRTSDGGYLIGGYSLSGISGDKTEASRGESDYWVVKLTSSGSKQWDKRFGGGLADELSCIIQASDGNYIIGGTTRSNISGDVSQVTRDIGDVSLGFNDYWIVKISATGAKLWDKRLGGSGSDILKTIISTTDGNFLLAGSSKSTLSGEKSEDGSYSGGGNSDSPNFCYWLVKINNIGGKLWDKTFNSTVQGYYTSTANSLVSNIVQTPDGGYLIGGSSQSDKNMHKSEQSRSVAEVFYDIGSIELKINYSYDYWMIKVNSNGTREWDKTFGGYGSEETGIALYNSDGSILLAGASTSAADGDKTQTSRGEYDFWLVKTKPFGTPLVSCTASGTIVREVWNNITGTAVSTIPVSTTPNTTGQLPLFESPTNAGDNYGQRIRGYICVPQTGNYTFWIAGDDNCELWLSTTDQALNKVKIAHITGTTALAGVREWNKYTTQQSVPIALQAGKRYYIEALHKENTGADNLAVGWQLPNGTLERPIPGNRLSPVTLVVNQAPIVSLTAPANNSSFVAPASITLTASASDGDGSISKVEFYRGTTKLGEDLTSPYSYSWQSVPAGSYGLTAKAIDNLGKTTTSSIINVTVQASCTASGTILREVWNNILGVEVGTIPLTTTPSATSQLTSFEAPSNIGSNYGQRIRGYICVPLTGSYTFYIAGDDNCELWLSTSNLPGNKARIAHISGTNAWAAVRQWTKYTTQKSAPISLQAGRRYYVEALHKENSGGDNLAVGWQLSTATTIDVIPGSVLSPFIPATATARVNQEPLSVASIVSLQVFPNPSSGDELYVQVSGLSSTEETILTIYDALGHVIEKYPVKATEFGEITRRFVFAHRLSTGMYTISLQANNEYLTERLIITK